MYWDIKVVPKRKKILVIDGDRAYLIAVLNSKLGGKSSVALNK